MAIDEFDLVRGEVDPLRRARRATDLVALYQQRSVELARLRRTAIEEAVRERGITYTVAAQAAGISKSRVSQQRKGGPPTARVLFGVGPVTVAVPTRAMPDRFLPVISAEDSIAAEQMSDLLRSYGFIVNQFHIPTDGQWRPTGDVVAICGPKSSSVTADALKADPMLDFTTDAAGRWVITDRKAGAVWGSPMDNDPTERTDVAYIGRIRTDEANVFLIAGVHAIGSVGAIHHLSTPGTAESLYAAVGEAPFSAVVRSTFDGATITDTDYAVPPRVHS
ncbi:hypothetical protein [Pengzhenrongella sp.]|uniref:hypothetical protein n=1 Tax=Pengzhenrongella sp. TaxID=2888820 RepID=UPI002F95BA78